MSIVIVLPVIVALSITTYIIYVWYNSDTVEKKINDIFNDKLAQRQNKYQEVENKNKEILKEFEIYKKECDKFKKDCNKFKADCITYKGTYCKKEEEIKTLVNDFNRLKQIHTRVEADLKTQILEATKLKVQLDTTNKQLLVEKSSNAKMQKIKNTMSIKLENITKQFTEITKQLQEAKNKTKKDLQVITQNKEKLAKCIGETTKHKKMIALMDRKKVELSTNFSELKAKYDIAYSNYDKNQEELIKLRNNLKILEGDTGKEIKNLKTENNTIKNMKKNIEDKFGKLDIDYKKLIGEYNKIKSQYADIIVRHNKLTNAIDECLPPILSQKMVIKMSQKYYRYHGPFTEAYMIPLKIVKSTNKTNDGKSINYIITYRFYDIYHDHVGLAEKEFKFKFDPVECEWYLFEMVNV